MSSDLVGPEMKPELRSVTLHQQTVLMKCVCVAVSCAYNKCVLVSYSSCPTPGCDGKGHVSGRYSRHRRYDSCLPFTHLNDLNIDKTIFLLIDYVAECLILYFTNYIQLLLYKHPWFQKLNTWDALLPTASWDARF